MAATQHAEIALDQHNWLHTNVDADAVDDFSPSNTTRKRLPILPGAVFVFAQCEYPSLIEVQEESAG